MLPQGSSHFRPAIRMIAVLILSLSAVQGVHAQAPAAPDSNPALQEPGPRTPEFYEAGGGQQRTSTGQSASTPVLTPGYFEVVCPAICYGGAFHVCNIKAFAGPGYYGPFRRYWAYGTYGPSFNIGPDDSLRYGLIGGVMYVVQRRCKGLYKHGTDPCPYAGAVPPIAGSSGGAGGGTAAAPASGASPPPAAGPGQRQPEKLPPPTGNTAYLRIMVPANAEVLVEGSKTATAGTVREFVSPPLGPGKNMIYSVLVRYTDAGGKKIEEAHSIRVHANDRLDIDCTKPANAEKPHAAVQRP